MHVQAQPLPFGERPRSPFQDHPIGMSNACALGAAIVHPTKFPIPIGLTQALLTYVVGPCIIPSKVVPANVARPNVPQCIRSAGGLASPQTFHSQERLAGFTRAPLQGLET